MKRRRAFLWAFLAVQGLFLAWLVLAIVSAATDPGRFTDPSTWQSALVGAVVVIVLLCALIDVILYVGRPGRRDFLRAASWEEPVNATEREVWRV